MQPQLIVFCKFVPVTGPVCQVTSDSTSAVGTGHTSCTLPGISNDKVDVVGSIARAVKPSELTNTKHQMQCTQHQPGVTPHAVLYTDVHTAADVQP